MAFERWKDYMRSLPESKDEARISVLYGALHQDRMINPEAWEGMLRFWERTLVEGVRGGHLDKKRSSLDARELINAMEWSGKRPICLEDVLYELTSRNVIRPYGKRKKKGIIGLYENWIKIPILSLMGSKNYADVVYMVVPAVKEYGEKLMRRHGNKMNYALDQVVSLKEFKTLMAEVYGVKEIYELDDIDVECLLMYLEEEGYLVYELENHDDKIIKFANKNIAKKKTKITITEVDRHIMKIKGTLEKLQIQVEELNKKIETIIQQSKELVLKARRAEALIELKRKKIYQTIVVKRRTAWQTLEHVLLKIQSAETDKEIIHAYQSGTKTIQHILSERGITTEVVNETFDQLQEILADQEEIDQAFSLGQSAISDHPFDEGSLEKELELLISADQIEQQNLLQEQTMPLVSKAPTMINDEIISSLQQMNINSSKCLSLPSQRIQQNGHLMEAPL